MNPHQSAGLLAYGMSALLMDGLHAVRRGNQQRQAQAALDAWDGALSRAQGSADAMADVAVAAIFRVAELEAEVAKLRRAVAYRQEALAQLS